MRILFIGCVEGSYRLLSELIRNNKDVVGVITKEQSAFNADYADLRPLCEKHSIPCHYVKNINDEDSLGFAKKLSPQICYCFGWSQLIKQEFLDLFPMGVVGFHPAALPNNRGRHPLIWALALGLKETASSFFMINVGADEGDIVSQRKVKIGYEDDARTLYDKVISVAVEQEIEFTEAFENGTAAPMSQDISKGNSWRKRGKADGQIDWRMPSKGIYNLVRSLTRPYVGAHFTFEEREYKVWKVQEIDAEGLDNIEPGKVLAVNQSGSIDVKTGIGAVRLIDFDSVDVKTGDYL